jgi:cell division protein FtsW (lipid II flippase)
MKVDDQPERTAGGSLWKGLGLALLCQFAYLLLVSELPTDEARILGFMLFALVQFGYLFPLAVFYHKRNEERTSNGIIIAGACSLLAAAVWFGYAASHGMLPSLGNN